MKRSVYRMTIHITNNALDVCAYTRLDFIDGEYESQTTIASSTYHAARKAGKTCMVTIDTTDSNFCLASDDLEMTERLGRGE